ncbi:MAG: CDP-alcohol phosphatidyltransferase family protein [Arenicellaceae bacterium]|nr:CDP-alcohol phosphatidyltransferase family protein [Arenicellaceae bacterium]
MPNVCEIRVQNSTNAETSNSESGSAALIRVAGLSVIERLLLGAAKAGISRAYITDTSQQTKQHLTNSKALRKSPVEIKWNATEKPLPNKRIVVEANVVVGNPVWGALVAATTNMSVTQAPSMEVVGYSETQPFYAESDASSSPFVYPVTQPEHAKYARKTIFKNVSKLSSGPVSRLINSKLSLPMSEFLSDYPATPNQLTIFSALIGMLSGYFIAFGSITGLIISGTLFQLSSALDGVDGELARGKFSASNLGAWIDTIGDNLVYITFIAGLAIGYSRFATTAELWFAGYVLPIGITTLALTITLIGGMALYLKLNKQSGTMTAVQTDLAQRVEREHVGFIYKTLDAVNILGKRDSFSFIVFLIAVVPSILGSTAGFHIMFWGALCMILMIILYYLIGLRNAR